MKYYYNSSEYFDLKVLENKLNKISHQVKKYILFSYVLVGIAIISALVALIFFNYNIIGIMYIIMMLIFFLFVQSTQRDSKDVGTKIDDISILNDSDNVKVLGAYGKVNEHLAEFINDCKAGKYYIPEVELNVANCNLLATDNHIAFFAYGNMYLAPIQSLLYIYGDAYKIKCIVLQLAILFKDGSTFEIQYEKETILAVEQFILNKYGILVGYSYENKKALNTDFNNFKKKCEDFKNKHSEEINTEHCSLSNGFPYSFLTKSSNPKRYVGSYSDLYCSIMSMIAGIIYLFKSGWHFNSSFYFSIFMIVLAIIRFINFLRKKFDL